MIAPHARARGRRRAGAGRPGRPAAAGGPDRGARQAGAPPFGGTLNVLLIVIVFLMVWKPGASSERRRSRSPGAGRARPAPGGPGAVRSAWTCSARTSTARCCGSWSSRCGAALFVANAWALVRRRADARDAARQAVVRGRPGSPVRKQVRVATTGNLAQAPDRPHDHVHGARSGRRHLRHRLADLLTSDDGGG